jgi:DNA-binding transcriptional LysR family regulator
MDRLSQYRVFVRVAEMGSFIKAVHALELPRATVSAIIAQLKFSHCGSSAAKGDRS